MNLQKLNKFSAFSAFAFAFFCLLWTILMLALLPASAGQKDYSLMVTDPQWTIVAITGLISSVFALIAVSGIYHRSHEKGGILLFAGVAIFSLGILFEFASLTWDVFIWPVMCANEQYIGFVSSGELIKTPQFKVFLILMLGSLFLGTVLTALALLKIKDYGKWSPWLLISGIVLYAAGGLVNVFVGTAGLVLYCLAFVLIGYRFLNPEKIPEVKR
jgi:hypothetical protein